MESAGMTNTGCFWAQKALKVILLALLFWFDC